MRFGKMTSVACTATVMLLAAVTLALQSSVSGGGKDEAAKSGKSPSVMFQPGAEVTFNFYFVLPAGHHFGEDPAAAVVFDEEALKGLPVKVKPLTFIWSGEEIAPSRAKNGMLQSTKTAEIKVKLAADCPLGELKIPVAVDVFFCNDEEGWCTNSHYDAVLTVMVSDSEKSVPKGSLKVCVVANPPEM